MLDTSAGGLGAMCAVFVLFLSLTLVLRFIARRKQQTSLGVDDWLTVPILFCFIGYTVAAIYAMSIHGLGYKAPSDPAALAALVPKVAETLFFMDWCAIIGMGCVRISALFFYRRIFNTHRRTDTFMILVYSMVGIVILWTIAYVLLVIFQCGTHVSNIWLAPRTCPSVTYPLLIGWAISSFILDVFVFVLPLPKVWLLHTSLKRKLSICAVFLLALAGLGASCARMVIFIKLWKQGPAANSLDPLETNTQAYYYVGLELGLCGVAVNLPSLWYFRSGIKAEKILGSIRSFTSLRSSRSSIPEPTHDLEKTYTNKSSQPTSPDLSTKRERMESIEASHFANNTHT